MLLRSAIPLRIWILGVLLASIASPATAERLTTRDAFDRLEEVLEIRSGEGVINKREVVPIILVSARPMFQESAGWYPVRAITALTRVFGRSSVRACEACMQPRTDVREGHLSYASGLVTLDEVVQLDDRYRGTSAQARTAVWLDETPTGVAIRIVDLRTAQIVFAQNVDPLLSTATSSARSFKLAAELERRNRGESITHAMYDVALYPGQHVSLEWDDQWGDTNRNLSGFALSFFDPILGVGASYHRVLGWRDVTVGAKVLLSIPTAIAGSQIDEDIEVLDPMLNAVFVMRMPFGDSNYAALLTASTNGRVGVGITWLNTSFLPFLP
ncbi:MAG: hypothetical protein ACE366_03880 [Bradymonadia bacterium]